MSQGPEAQFSWLLGCCVSDDASAGSLREFAALFFASGMVASGLTIYLASLLHVL